MITEAGCDLHELLHPTLIRDHDKNGGEAAPLCVVALDEKLGHLCTQPELQRRATGRRGGGAADDDHPHEDRGDALDVP